jgi:ABC-type sugar transport system substrate-binding protein
MWRLVVWVQIIIGSLLLAGSISAQARWLGADLLPTNPLSCDAETQNDILSGRYDGGQPTNPPDLSGRPVVIVNVQRSLAPSYDRAIAQGMQEAAAELGNVELIESAPGIINIGQQTAEYAFGGAQGVLFAATSQDNIAPALRAGLAAGIRVVGYDVDLQPEAREWFVRPVQDNELAKALIDSLVQQTGEAAGFVLMVESLDAPETARWIAEMWAYAQACYPDLEWLETVENQGDKVVAYNQTTLLLSDYGSDLDAVVSLTISTTQDAAEAVKQSGLCGRVAVTGLSTPKSVQSYVNDDCVQAVVLWQPVDLGYAAVYVMRAVMDGALQPGSSAVSAGRLGRLPVVNGSEILLGAPAVFDASNIDDFDF